MFDTDWQPYQEPVGVALDANGDGYAETTAFDMDRNGLFDTATVDSNGDGYQETRLYDNWQDGTWDYAHIDTDGNGVGDTKSFDTNGDGILDRTILDVNNNNVDDVEEAGPGWIQGMTPGYSSDPTINLIYTLVRLTGQPVYGTPDYDRDGWNDNRDYFPSDPLRH